MHRLLIAIFLFWLTYFQIGRGIFIGANFHLLQPSDNLMRDIIESFIKALSLDRAMAAYLVVISWFFVLILGQTKQGWLSRAMMLSTGFFTIVYSLVAVGDAFLYSEWKSKLNARALSAFAHPSEILRVTTWWQLLLECCLVFVYSYVGIKGFQWIIDRMARKTLSPGWNLVVLVLVWPIALGVIARGGTKAIAIDVSRVYFSPDQTLNDAATNPANYLIRNLMQTGMYVFGQNPFQSMNPTVAKEKTENLHKLKTTELRQPTPPLTTVTKPNLIFVVLESWSADLIESLGGRPGITPRFRELEKEGLSFNQFYTNGNRSQQGIASIFGGFPALPRGTITEDPSKTKSLPKLAKIFEHEGYETSFYYGGQLEYGNIKSFLIHSGFQTIIEDDHLPRQFKRSNLGVNDSTMMSYFLDQLQLKKQPFFSGLFTLSSHAPYDIPETEAKDFGFEGLEGPYVRSVMYTDKALGEFMDQMKERPWYQDSLVVIVSDHSHNTFFNRPTYDPLYRKIPFLITGGALNQAYRGKTLGTIGSQIDIPATLLNQLGMGGDAARFVWSKDLFDSRRKPFAYYEFGGGFGWVTDKGTLVYDYDEKQVKISSMPPEDVPQTQSEGMAYLQTLFQTFIDL